MAIPFAATVPGTPWGVRLLRRRLSAVAADCGMDSEGIADVRLAVTEAATNAVMHAYAEGPPPPYTTASSQSSSATPGPGWLSATTAPASGWASP
jgi:anti-sigma regulatory factor (Ser/Thr protein kinase)